MNRKTVIGIIVVSALVIGAVALRSQVQALDDEVKSLSQQPVVNNRAVPTSSDRQIPKGFPGSFRVPFNHDYYYVVPLAQISGVASTGAAVPNAF